MVAPEATLTPYGPPLTGPVMARQWWLDVAFLHWRVPVETVAPMLPAGVRPDLFDGSAWVGLVPFRLVGMAAAYGLSPPRSGTFLELNVRTYSVDPAGHRGVVFQSLDAAGLVAVTGGRTIFNLPYQWASMSLRRNGSQISYAARRRGPGPAAQSRLTVDVEDPRIEPSELEVFLTARYGLHTTIAGQTMWIPNTHGEWPLHRAHVVGFDDTVLAAAGYDPGLAAQPPESVLASAGVHTEFGYPQRVRGAAAAP